MIENLRPFQRKFLSAAFKAGIDTACLSVPRGNGKSALAAHVLEECLTPGSALFQKGAEYVLVSGSLEQARTVFRFVRSALEPTGAYRWQDGTTAIGAVHLATNTRLRVRSSSGKTLMGLVNVPLVVVDECGSFDVAGGEMINAAIQGAMGKPESPLRALYVSTLAPARSGWWHDLIAGGCHGSTYVQSLQGDPSKWADWREIRRCNPLTSISADFRRRLREERNDALRDDRRRAAFCSYRLNLPTRDSDDVLLPVEAFERMIDRPTPEASGSPIVGFDLGAGRAFSSASAVYESGRVECFAVAPGEPSIEDQEKRDRVPAGTYRRLADEGQLEIADGLLVPPVGLLWQGVLERWGCPSRIICDRFRLGELVDVVAGATVVEPRITRWSEASYDIRALRAGAADGPLAVAPSSRALLAASFSVAMIKSDDAGSMRMIKSKNNTARDDTAAALLLAAGAHKREADAPVIPPRYHGLV